MQTTMAQIPMANAGTSKAESTSTNSTRDSTSDKGVEREFSDVMKSRTQADKAETKQSGMQSESSDVDESGETVLFTPALMAQFQALLSSEEGRVKPADVLSALIDRSGENPLSDILGAFMQGEAEQLSVADTSGELPGFAAETLMTDGNTKQLGMADVGMGKKAEKVTTVEETVVVAAGNTGTSALDMITKPQSATEVLNSSYLNELGTQIAEKLDQGNNMFEIELQPQYLGKLTIKATYESGRAIISIVCTDSDTMNALTKSAGELAAIIESRSGSETQVVVDKPAADYLQQNEQQGQNQRQSRERERKGDEDKIGAYGDSASFAQQLRLGLVSSL